MTETVVAIGTRKGLWLARSTDRREWALDGPHFLMSEVASVAFDTRRGAPRVLAGVMSWHWGPTVQVVMTAAGRGPRGRSAPSPLRALGTCGGSSGDTPGALMR